MTFAELDNVDEGRRRKHFLPGESLLQSDGAFFLSSECGIHCASPSPRSEKMNRERAASPILLLTIKDTEAPRTPASKKIHNLGSHV